MSSFANDLPEDGIYGPKHVGEASQNNKYLWLHVQFVGLKYCTVTDGVSIDIYVPP
jgi:hypothetical protein